MSAQRLHIAQPLSPSRYDLTVLHVVEHHRASFLFNERTLLRLRHAGLMLRASTGWRLTDIGRAHLLGQARSTPGG